MKHHAGFDAPELGQVLASEHTVRGWRGLTSEGEILDVTVERKNGHAVTLPDSLRVSRKDGTVVGYYAIPKEVGEVGVIDRYQRHFDHALGAFRKADYAYALEEIDAAMALCRTARASFNRALILLSLGKWEEGFDAYAWTEDKRMYMRPEFRQCLDCGLERWRGENIYGKKLLLIHDHGFGDSIQCLRYVPMLRKMGADVALMVPKPLQRLAAQCAPVTDKPVQADYFCSLIFLLQVLGQNPDNMPREPYLKVYDELHAKWRERIGERTHRKRIGITWSVGKFVIGDYPREMTLERMVEGVGGDDVELHAVQQQGDATDQCGVKHWSFEDFADCAALMSLMDEIVTVDTAGVHLAGAIGHPNITLLLSHWHSWRWQLPLYQNMRICIQPRDGDWNSTFAQRRDAVLS